MIWKLETDNTEPVITAKESIKTCLGTDSLDLLPENCVMFFCSGAFDVLKSEYFTNMIIKKDQQMLVLNY